jgi:methylthioribulose-1-phosphate dehydratase
MDPTHPTLLIPELLRLFYQLGWVTGTGGGICIRQEDVVYIAPSGVQKERVQSDQLFVLKVPTPCYPPNAPLVAPPHLTPSACTPLFFTAFRVHPRTMCCIHTHSQHAVMATLLWDKEFVVTHLEMIKGVRNATTGTSLQYDDTLVVPIIDNTCHEADLKDALEQAMLAYPHASACLVRRHGVYVWGETWEKTKSMAECYDYLFELAVAMKQAGIDPSISE